MADNDPTDKVLELLTKWLFLELEMMWTEEQLSDFGCSPYDPELADLMKHLRISVGEAELETLEYEIDLHNKKAGLN